MLITLLGFCQPGEDTPRSKEDERGVCRLDPQPHHEKAGCPAEPKWHQRASWDLQIM